MTITYKPPMYSRLVPQTPWSGGRITDTDVLTLADAASMATKHARETVTIGDILRAAAREEITLRAIVNRTAKTQPGRVGDAPLNENKPVPKGCIPTLPLEACKALVATGRASWRTFDWFERAAIFGGELCRYTRWQLTDDEPDFETTLDDCRVTGNDVHALADAFIVAPVPTDSTAPTLIANEQETGNDVRWSDEKLRALLGAHDELKKSGAKAPTTTLAGKYSLSAKRIREHLVRARALPGQKASSARLQNTPSPHDPFGLAAKNHRKS